MKWMFTDKDFEYGEVQDDGSTYSWSYEGDREKFIGVLTRAEEWTGMDTALVESDGDGESDEKADDIQPLAAERFDGRISPDFRILKIRRMLRNDTDWAKLEH